ncbi:MAG: flagellar export protein FliJ [Balneolaceae bacterium]
MKFTFSLEPVLKVRKHQEKLKKQELAEQLQKKQEIDELRSEVMEKLNGYLRHEHHQKAANIHAIRQRSQHMVQANHTMNRLNRDLEKVESEVGKKRQNLAEIHKKRHVLEKVKEKELKRFKHHFDMKEQHLLDEIATQSYNK